MFNGRYGIAWLVITITVLAGCASSEARATGERQFKWKEGKVYDGNTIIARFDIKSMSFSEVKLKPGGKVLIDEWSIYWSKGTRCKTVLNDKFSVDDSKPNCLKMHIESRSRGHQHYSKSVISISYDKELRTYVYEVKTQLRTNRYREQRFLQRPPKDFARIVFREPDKPYKQYVYQGRAGEWIKVPLNYLLTPDKFDMCFKRGNAVTAMFNPAGDENPVIELTGLTPQNAAAGCVLPWPAPTLFLVKSRQVIWPCGQLMDPACYKIYCYDKKRLEGIVRTAKARKYSSEEVAEYDRPRFEAGKVNDFEEAIGLDKATRSGFWTFAGDMGLTCWSRKVGYKSRSSLKCGDTTKAADCRWEIAPPDAGPKLLPGKHYVLSAYIKTEKLEGEGAYVVCVPGKGITPITSKKITGVNDWQKVSITIPAGKTARTAHIQLRHKGKGISYFDRVRLEPVSAK